MCNKLLNHRNAVIIANGCFPTHDMALSVLRKSVYTVCCDGAANDFIARGEVPDAIVGDCDSISEENRMRFADILHRDPDQETNDLTKAIMFCASRGRRDIVILGGTGKREDHTLGNISLLAEYVKIANVAMITDYGIFKPIVENTVFESFRGQQISIFAMDRQPISSNGLKYPLNKRVLNGWWEGTLNETLGEKFTIETSGVTLVFFAFEGKL